MGQGMTDRELMQQALVALEAMQSYAAAEKKGLRICDEAIEALRAQLTQAEQELVAWSRVNMNDHKEGDLGIGTVKWDASAPLVVHPHPAFQTIEALRARLAQPEQEPVAWITDGGKGELWWHQSVKFDDDGNLIGENPDDIPLYTTPPQRKWQGLTDEEIKSIYDACDEWGGFEYERSIEAKLKEKNA